MPLPRAEREIELLTEGWPGDPDDFELAAFAATFRADRPELSAPALDRIGHRMRDELSRLERFAERKRFVRATTLRFRRYTPVAAAAVVALAVGAWVHFRSGSPANRGLPGRSVPVIRFQPGSSPDAPHLPAPATPIVN